MPCPCYSLHIFSRCCAKIKHFLSEIWWQFPACEWHCQVGKEVAISRRLLLFETPKRNDRLHVCFLLLLPLSSLYLPRFHSMGFFFLDSFFDGVKIPFLFNVQMTSKILLLHLNDNDDDDRRQTWRFVAGITLKESLLFLTVEGIEPAVIASPTESATYLPLNSRMFSGFFFLPVCRIT